MQNDEFEQYKSLVYDEGNVTETKPLLELFKILVKLVIILVLFYGTVYFGSGIVLKNLSIENQIKLEKFLAAANKTKTVEIPDKDKIRLKNTLNKIIEKDPNFPKTSTFNIGIINMKQKNALCLPDGTIYITSELYGLLDDEMLTFVVAHEAGHYKNRDHLLKLKKYIAINSVVILTSVLTSNNADLSNAASDIMQFENLNYSRIIEAKADLYAKNMMNEIYGNVDGGVRVLDLLRSKKYPIEWTVFSTHPTINKRIKALKK